MSLSPPDPAEIEGSKEKKLAAFRKMRDEIGERIQRPFSPKSMILDED